MCNIINTWKGLQQDLSLQQTTVIQHTAFSLYPNETENLRKVEKHLSIHSWHFYILHIGQAHGQPCWSPFSHVEMSSSRSAISRSVFLGSSGLIHHHRGLEKWLERQRKHQIQRLPAEHPFPVCFGIAKVECQMLNIIGYFFSLSYMPTHDMLKKKNMQRK